MKKKRLRIFFAVFLIAGMGFLFFRSIPGQTVELNLSDPAARKECRICHTGPYRHQIDDSREPWCVNCHQLHHLGNTLGLEAYFQQAVRAAEPQKGEEIIGQKMVLIPAGEFMMGEDFFKKNAGPRHSVHLEGYSIDQYDVTNAHYKRFIDATGRMPPPHWSQNQYPPGKANHPVTFVGWFDADAYCKWDGKRLPTEAEWEKAARGIDGRMFPWGGKLEPKHANVPPEGIKDTTPVNAFPEGRSPYGLYDMSGNVFQWTADWFLPYPGNSVPHPNYGEKLKVLRGGSFFDCSYYKCGLSFQTFNRIALSPATKTISAGFRCAKSMVKNR